MIFDDSFLDLPVVPPKSEEPVKKIGSILPLEKDHNLRTFEILNNEGEIFKINTALKGPFHGPVWTKILSCYENRQTIRGRVIAPVTGKSGNQAGYEVKFGNIKAFMPNYHSLLTEFSKGINMRVAIIEINPVTKHLIVSARAAYTLLFAHKSVPEVGEETDALYWDYDDKEIYYLLPGRFLGHAPHSLKRAELASLMGTLTKCYVQTLDSETRDVTVTFSKISDTPSEEYSDKEDFFHEAEESPLNEELPCEISGTGILD